MARSDRGRDARSARVVSVVILAAIAGALIAYVLSSLLPARYVARAAVLTPTRGSALAVTPGVSPQTPGPAEQASIAGEVARMLALPRQRVEVALVSSAAPTVSLYFLKPPVEPPAVDFQATWSTAAGAAEIAGTAARIYAGARHLGGRPGRSSVGGAVVAQRSPRVLRDVALGFVAAAVLAAFVVTVQRDRRHGGGRMSGYQPTSPPPGP